jgi:hypothetical protein
MTKYRLILALILSAVTALPAAAAPNHAAITTTQIASAISGWGMNVSAEQVTLLTDVMATTNTPTLQVESIVPWGDRRMKVRLDCATSEECLPFFVAINGIGQNAQNAGQPSSAGSDRSSIAALQPEPGSKSIAVRNGSLATLLLEGGHVHIRLIVVCLENGAPGQTIRAESKDHQQTYIAQVVDKGVLRGTL